MPVQNLQTLCITAALPFWPLTTGLGEARTKNSALAPPKAQYHQKSAVPTCSKPQQSLHRAFYPSHFRQTWGQAASKTPSQVPQGITMAGMFWLAFSQGFLPASSLLKFHLVSQTGDRIFLPFVTQEGILLLSDARNCCVVSRRWTQSQWLPAKLQTMLPRPLFFPRSRAAWPQDMDVHLTAAWSSLLPLHTFFFFPKKCIWTGTQAKANILAQTSDFTLLISPREIWLHWLQAAVAAPPWQGGDRARHTAPAPQPDAQKPRWVPSVVLEPGQACSLQAQGRYGSRFIFLHFTKQWLIIAEWCQCLISTMG